MPMGLGTRVPVRRTRMSLTALSALTREIVVPAIWLAKLRSLSDSVETGGRQDALARRAPWFGATERGGSGARDYRW